MTYDPQVQQLSSKFASNIFIFSDEHADIRDKVVFDSSEKWALGYLSGSATTLVDTIVTSWSELDSQYLDGTWEFSYYISPEATTLAGARVIVEGTGVDAEFSIDGGETFLSPADFYEGLDITDGLDIVLRMNLSGGIEQSVVTRATLTLYDSLTIKGTNSNIPATISDVPEEFSYDPADFSNGVYGPITIPGDTDIDYVGVEFTILPDSSTSTAAVFSLTPTALYVNGEPVTAPATLDADEWAHVIAVFAANTTGFTVGSSGSVVGYLATYLEAIGVEQAAAIYNWWAGTSAIRVVDPETITVSEDDSPWQLHSQRWSAPRLTG